MKISCILCAIGILIVVHLSFLVVADDPAKQRSLSDDIRSGISLAGKIFGVDSPTNIATISNIAELVSRAFSNKAPSNTYHNNNNDQDRQSNWHDRHSMEKQHSSYDGIETFDDQSNPMPQENAIDDGVIVGSGMTTGPVSTNSADHGFIGRILRVIGMDTNKIGALAVNGIIFVAQMIGQSLMSTFNRVTGTKRTGGSDTMSNYQEQMYRNEPSRSSSILENAFEWIYEQSNKNPVLAKYVTAMLDKDLPENVVKLIEANNDKMDRENAANVDCVKLLVCKSAPIIWGMQEAVSKQMNGEADDSDTDKSGKTTQEDRVDAFFKYLPDVKVFQSHGDGCEQRYAACNIF